MSEGPKRLSKSDRFLKLVELSIVATVAVSMWVAAGFTAFWVAFGTGEVQEGRLSKAVNGVNANWKTGLLLLIPLFYRTTREILERMEEGPFGSKFPKPKTPTAAPQEEEETRPAEGTK
jgi:hypothetical protein